MRRGELWSYVPRVSPRQQVVALVSSDGINDSARPWLVAAPVAAEDPRDILAVPVEYGTGKGWVSAGNLTRVYRSWLHERVGQLDTETLDEVDTALRAALDL